MTVLCVCGFGVEQSVGFEAEESLERSNLERNAAARCRLFQCFDQASFDNGKQDPGVVVGLIGPPTVCEGCEG